MAGYDVHFVFSEEAGMEKCLAGLQDLYDSQKESFLLDYGDGEILDDFCSPDHCGDCTVRGSFREVLTYDDKDREYCGKTVARIIRQKICNVAAFFSLAAGHRVELCYVSGNDSDYSGIIESPHRMIRDCLIDGNWVGLSNLLHHESSAWFVLIRNDRALSPMTRKLERRVKIRTSPSLKDWIDFCIYVGNALKAVPPDERYARREIEHALVRWGHRQIPRTLVEALKMHSYLLEGGDGYFTAVNAMNIPSLWRNHVPDNEIEGMLIHTGVVAAHDNADG